MITARDREIEWYEGMTVSDVLKVLNLRFTFLLVKVDNQIVKKKEWESFKVPDGSRVDAHPIVAGG